MYFVGFCPFLDVFSVTLGVFSVTLYFLSFRLYLVHVSLFLGVSGAHLVLQGAVLALRVLPDDEDVDVAVPRLHPGQALAVNHVGVEIQAGPGTAQNTTKNQPQEMQMSPEICK